MEQGTEDVFGGAEESFRVEFGNGGGLTGPGGGGERRGGGPGLPGRGLRGARGHPGRKEVILQEEPGISRRGGGGRFGSAQAGVRDLSAGARAWRGGVPPTPPQLSARLAGPRPGGCWSRSQTAGPGRNSRHSLCLSCQ